MLIQGVFMPELCLYVPQSIIDGINQNLKKINRNDAVELSANEIGREALAYYDWITKQIDDGKAIVSMNKHKMDLNQLSTPALPAMPPKR